MDFLSLGKGYEKKLTYMLAKYNANDSLSLFQAAKDLPEVTQFKKLYDLQLEKTLKNSQKYLSWYVSRFHGDRDDLYQEAVLGVISSFARFNPQKGVFQAYAKHWINKHILLELNRQKFIELSLIEYDYKLIFSGQGSEDPLDHLLFLEENDLLKKGISQLSPRQGKIISALLENEDTELTASKFAKIMSLSCSRISQIIKSAGEKIKNSIQY